MAKSAAAREPFHVLRREIAKIEGSCAVVSSGSSLETSDVTWAREQSGRRFLATRAPAFDKALGGGLPQAGLSEIHGSETRHAGIATGFSVALLAHDLAAKQGLILWILMSDTALEAGMPYAPGLDGGFGLSADRFLFARASHLRDALWIAEEGANLDALAAIILETRGYAKAFDLTATQRLHFRAKQKKHPVLLIRQAGTPEPTAAPVRLVVGPAPSGLRNTLTRNLPRSIGPPRFEVEISKSRTTAHARFILEWNADECALIERNPDLSAVRVESRSAHSGSVISLSGNRQGVAAQARPQMADAEAGTGLAGFDDQPSRTQRAASGGAR